MKLYLTILLFFLAIPYVHSNQEQTAISIAGRSWTLGVPSEWVEGLEGVRRQLLNERGGTQFYYFCDKAKGERKKQCGAWVDEKGNKIKSAKLPVKLTNEGVEFSNLQVSDSARYSRFPENSDETQAELERVSLYVSEGPTTAPPNAY